MLPNAPELQNSITLLHNTARNYSTVATTPRLGSVENLNLNPNWVTGFVDGEGCFHISILERKKRKFGWQVSLHFQIGLHVKDRAILDAIKELLDVGEISKQGSFSIQLQVQSIKEFQVLLDHFDKYPLITTKKADYKALKLAYFIIKNKEHLTKEGLRKIIAIRSSMNRGLSEKLQVAFPDVVTVERPLVELPQTIDPNWLAGFTSGEGCFLVIVERSTTKIAPIPPPLTPPLEWRYRGGGIVPSPPSPPLEWRYGDPYPLAGAGGRGPAGPHRGPPAGMRCKISFPIDPTLPRLWIIENDYYLLRMWLRY